MRCCLEVKVAFLYKRTKEQLSIGSGNSKLLPWKNVMLTAHKNFKGDKIPFKDWCSLS